MSKISVIGLDIAKRVFQVHGADAAGRPLQRVRLSRPKVLSYFADLPPCLVGIEACATAHHWAREIQALGHEVRLIPPQYVKPFVKSNKNDASDAEAIAEALVRPTMRFTAIKTREQQALLMLHRMRELLVRQRTMQVNALRAHCAEFGVVTSQGVSRVQDLVDLIESEDDTRIPAMAREALKCLIAQLQGTQEQIAGLERRLGHWHRCSEPCRRLSAIPGVGVITATALVATIGDGAQFHSARQFAAWLGIVPRQTSSGGRERLGRISKRGDGYLRRLLVHGARSVLRWRKAAPRSEATWSDKLLARRPTNVALVAMAHKTARIAWALLRHDRTYQPRAI